MTDNEIINAEESEEEKRAEIERLNVELKAMRGAANSYKLHYGNMKAEVAREVLDRVTDAIVQNTYPSFDKDGKPINVWKTASGYRAIDALRKEMESENNDGP